ncbi:MAG: LacI family DNA-binding transcriptional regulator [Spirochaetales bacterium]|nr:LacI family DNA-binding transcriptional regulator [Spirochaetales bacterium]
MSSQRDVAQKANVSFMTVSRVINGHGNVKKATRDKVLKAIRELGYYPNAAARALNRNKTNVIGIVVPYYEHFLAAPYFVELLLAIERYVSVRGYDLIFNTSTGRSDKKDYSILYKHRKIDGLIIFAPSIHDDSSLADLVRDHVPFVIVGGRDENVHINHVDIDNEKGTREAIDYLLSLGHRRIGCVTGILHVIDGRNRLHAYLDTLRAAKVETDNDLIFEGDFTEKSGRDALHHFWSLKSPPTAVFCSNDHMALGVFQGAHERDLRIPADLSVVGFDDISLASYLSPPLTTVRQPIDVLGQRAARLMIASIERRPPAGSKIIVEPELIIRSSCAKPR